MKTWAKLKAFGAQKVASPTSYVTSYYKCYNPTSNVTTDDTSSLHLPWPLTMIILESYFIKRDGNIRAVRELSCKLPDWHLKLIGKQVSEKFSAKFWKGLTSWSHPFGPHMDWSTPSEASDSAKNSDGSGQKNVKSLQFYIDKVRFLNDWHLYLWLYSASDGQCPRREVCLRTRLSILQGFRRCT